MMHQLRAVGVDENQIADDIEVVFTAAELDQHELRAIRIC